MSELNYLISILSLLIAVFTVLNARYQIKTSLSIASKQITEPMRQAWINTLRDLLSELLSRCYFFSQLLNKKGQGNIIKEKKEVSERIFLLIHKIQLMLNPKEEDHIKLEELVFDLFGFCVDEDFNKEGTVEKFLELQSAIVKISREIIKKEWDRIKNPFS